MQKDLKKFESKKLQIVGVSYDKVSILKSFSTKANIKFPLFSDTGSKVIKAYGIHNRRGLPHPTTFVVNKDGSIHSKLPGTTRTRHTTEQLLKALEKK